MKTKDFSIDALSRCTWNLPFCGLTSMDWMVDPLNETQELHAAYRMELWDAFLKKIGTEVVVRWAGLNHPHQRKFVSLIS